MAAPRGVDRMIFGVSVVLSAVILFSPTVPGPPLFPNADKVIHFLIFAALAWTGLRAGIPAAPLAVAVIAYAITSELVQGAFLPDRSGSWSDLAADVLGTVAGFTLVWLRRRQ